MNIKDEVLKLEDELIKIRRELHMIPELGHEEFETSKYIENYLTRLGITFIKNSGTGIVGLIKGNRQGKTLLLRADIDALPQTEETDVDYKSRYEGRMHACGHDGHTAILLITAKILMNMRDKINGCIKIVFQPNEEGAGALKMIEEGVMENPMVDSALSLHLWTPIESGTIGLKKGAVMGTTEEFEIEVIGKSGHTSAPHTSIDPIITATAIVQGVQFIQTRDIDPLNPITIMFGKINGGTARNIIPERVTLGGTIRFLIDEEKVAKHFILERFEEIVEGICKAYKSEVKINFLPSNTSVYNHQDMINIAKKSAKETLGDENKIIEYVCLAGEDFAEFSKIVPSCFAFIGTGNKLKGSDYPHHHPKFNIDEDTLKIGVEYMVRSAINYCN